MEKKKIENWTIIFRKLQKNAFIGPRDRSPSAIFGRRARAADRVSRQSRCILRACCTWRAYGEKERRCRPNPTSVLRSRLHPPRMSFGAPVPVVPVFQSPVDGVSRGDSSGAARSPLARVRSRGSPFTLVRRARARLPSVFSKDNVGPRVLMDDVPSSVLRAIRRDVVARRSLHVTLRVNATLDERHEEITRDRRCGRRDGQRGGGCVRQRRGLRLRLG